MVEIYVMPNKSNGFTAAYMANSKILAEFM
jgi:hypothetical protein